MIALKPITDDHPALQSSPLIRGVLLLMARIEEHGPIPLTPSTAFKRVFVEWAAHHFDWPGHRPEDLYAVNRVLNEQDFLPLMVIHDLLLQMKLGRNYKGSFRLTKAGQALAGRPAALFSKILPWWLTEFNHSALARFDAEEVRPDWRIYLNILNVEAEGGVTGARLREIFCEDPTERDRPSFDDGSHALSLHVLRPLVWIGLLDKISGKPRYQLEKATYVKTPLWEATLLLMTDPLVRKQTRH